MTGRKCLYKGVLKKINLTSLTAIILKLIIEFLG
tara:strand:+ start:287 stop:388 length:102 start_codon:yes stop_codon:yes gene_type:complete